MNKRRGKFYVSTSLLHSDDFWIVLAEMKFIPARVEQLYDRDAFEYVGLSHLFREVPQGEITPEYEIIICKEGAVISVKAVEL